MKKTLSIPLCISIVLSLMAAAGSAHGERVIAKPRAFLAGPCGHPVTHDGPHYSAVFDNSASTAKVTFKFHYKSRRRHAWVTILRPVRGGYVNQTKFLRVVGGSVITICALGRVLRQKRAAPAGKFPIDGCYQL